ncbi:hypothetical protein STPYR_12378 [uncultured Stenotrophomonas sp.]|uniref:Probable membrane transporter protein n=1 Tax=uncultured Stenotrophomonas sp. TaxID=165438 RepID=A0A1Y5Q564_9GAMM|nr:hypothetical protein STPYR_12378 [uncultured Stenotrophomonas sp.]
MLELLPAELPWLIVIAFVAGLVDAAVGGGGLIQLPGLFTTLPQQTPAALLGTNKFSSMFGTGAAAWRYARSVRFPWRPVLLAALAALHAHGGRPGKRGLAAGRAGGVRVLVPRCHRGEPAVQGGGAATGARAAGGDARLYAGEEGFRRAAPPARGRPPRAGHRAGDGRGDRLLRRLLRPRHRQLPDFPVRALLRAGFLARLGRLQGGEPGHQRRRAGVLRAQRQRAAGIRGADGGGQHRRLGGRHAHGVARWHTADPPAVPGAGGGADRAHGVGHLRRLNASLPI